ncbi:MAG TPA: sporulation integral membrane protein YtvI [Bacillota bacterium]|nr:sporulation integral membrane protein YtvI [Bacillota bacterium]
MDHLLKTRLFQITRCAFIILIITGLLWLVKILTPLLYPFLIAFIIAIVINRPVNLLQKRAKLPRWLSVVIVLLILIAIVIGVVTIMITQLVIEISHLITVMPIYILDATNYVKKLITQEIITNFYDRFQIFYSALDESYKSNIEETIGLGFSKVAKAGTYLVNTILVELQAFLTSLPNTATVFVISLLAAFFISKDFYHWKTKLSAAMPLFIQTRAQHVLVDLKKALVGFIKAQFTLISITAFIVIIGLLILRVEYAFTLGILTGIVDLLPLLGTGSVFIPWIVYLFIKHDYQLVIGIAILYAVVVIQRQIMEPKIVADNIGLDPLLTLVALFVGLQLFGVAGLILGPVSIVIINALHNAGVFRDLWIYVIGE